MALRRLVEGRPAAAALAVFAAVALATSAPLWTTSGWPENHEGSGFSLRTLVYMRHFTWWDLAPIWSSADADGFGTPFPLLYHKLFYLLAAGLALLTGSIRVGLTTAIVLLLVGGAAGMYWLVRALGASRVAGVVAGISLIAANYTVTNWLVRGALAEFSGAMVMPWVLWAFVRSVRAGRWTVEFGVALALLWLAHTVVGYFTGLLLAATYLLLAATRQASWSFLDPRRSWRAAVVCIALVAPFLVPMMVISPAYEIGRILADPYRPVHQFRDLALYFRDPLWEWGRIWHGYTTVLDLPLLIAAGAAAAILVVRWRMAAWDSVRPILPVLLPGVLALLLQSRSASWFYTLVPGAEFIQFPWRLLALMTPALIVAATTLVARALPSSAGSAALGALAIWMVAVCGTFAPRQYGRLELHASLDGVTFSAFREYEPRTAPPIDELRRRIEAAWAAQGCAMAAHDRTNHELPYARYDVTCTQPATLPLPLYASPFHTVQHEAGGTTAGCLTLRDLPALCGVAVRRGRSTVQVNFPHLGAVARWAWRGGSEPAPSARESSH